MVTATVSNLLLGTVGFIISGCLATGNRWRHLAYVALGAWATSVINVLFLGVEVEQWMLSGFFMAFIMGMGGGLSYLFKGKHSRPGIASSVLSVVFAVLLLVVILVAGVTYAHRSAPAAGQNHENRQLVQQSDAQAVTSYVKAAEQGDVQAQTPQQIAEAERRMSEATEAKTQAQAAAQFEKDFYEKYPDLKPYGAVVDAVATKLGAQGFTAPTREAVMEAFAKGAREEIKHQQQPALPPGALVLKGEWGNTPRITGSQVANLMQRYEAEAHQLELAKKSAMARAASQRPTPVQRPDFTPTDARSLGLGPQQQAAFDQIAAGNAANWEAAERDRELREREQALREQQVEDAQEAARARAQSLQAALPQPAWQVRPENPPPSVPQVELGTGFFVTDDGYFLTCCHVIEGASHISIRSGQARYLAKLVRADSQNDLALLKVTGTFRSLPVAPLASVKLGDPVFTIGFPNPDLQGFEPKLTKGDVSSLAGGRDNPLYFQISVPVQPGNSGGALVNTVGNVVGIVSDRLSDSAALETTGMLAQNVNYAVKCDSVIAFLGALPEVLGKLKSPYRPKDRKSEDVVKEAQDATALVIASAY